MNNTCGCAPIYFSGAILFLAGGGTLIYYDYTIIGATVMVPGLILLGLTFFMLDTLSRFKRGDDRIKVVIKDPGLLKELKNRHQTRFPHKKQKRQKRKK